MLESSIMHHVQAHARNFEKFSLGLDTAAGPTVALRRLTLGARYGPNREFR